MYIRYDKKLIRIKLTRKVEKGEEILVNVCAITKHKYGDVSCFLADLEERQYTKYVKHRTASVLFKPQDSELCKEIQLLGLLGIIVA